MECAATTPLVWMVPSVPRPSKPTGHEPGLMIFMIR